MKAYRCDVCKEYHDGLGTARFSLKDLNWIVEGYQHIHLCPLCFLHEFKKYFGLK